MKLSAPISQPLALRSPIGKGAFLLAVSAFVSLNFSAQAANKAWNTTGNPNGTFSGATNWTVNTVPVAGPGTSAAASGDALYFGTSDVTALSNDLTGASYAGITFNSGASAFTFSGNSFTLTGNLTNSSTALQTFGSAISTTAARAFTAVSGGGGLTFNGGIASNSTGGTTTFTTGGASNAAQSTSPITLAGTNTFASSSNNTGNNIQAGAVVNITGTTTFSGTAVNSGGMGVIGNSKVTVSTGGTLNLNGSSNANPTTQTIIGQAVAGTTSTLLVDGGTVNFAGGTAGTGGGQGFFIGNANATQAGVLTIQNNGSVTINRASGAAATQQGYFIAVGRDTATGTINLNGGTLATDRNFVRDGNGPADAGGTAVFNFGGGTLKALGAQTDWINSATINTNQLAFTSVTATGTSTIDANDFAVAIKNAITGNGGFSIVDSSVAKTGSVTLGGTSTFAGGVSVTSGKLIASASGALGTGTLTIDGGAFESSVANVNTGNVVLSSGSLTINTAGVGTLTLGGTNTFTMSGGAWNVNLASLDSIAGGAGSTFSITGGTLALSNVTDYNATYNLLTGFTSGSASGLSITGYDTANHQAILSTGGVLSFTAVPEPHAYALVISGLLVMVIVMRRRPFSRSA